MSEHWYEKALEEVVSTIIDWGQYPKDGRPAIRLIEEIPEDFIYEAFTDMVGAWTMQGQSEAIERVRKRLDEMLRDKLSANQYVSNLADDMQRRDAEDRAYDEEVERAL